MNKFAAVGISGLVVCVVCLAAAGAVGGRALGNLNWNLGSIGDGDHCDFPAADRIETRQMPWTGGSEVAIAVPAMVTYRSGQGDAVIVKGDAALLPHIHIADSTIKLDCRWNGGHKAIEVTLPGRHFDGFKIAGAAAVNLSGIDQPSLRLDIAGAGQIKADGKVERLDLDMAGAGDAKLGSLSATRVKVQMAGANHAVVAPKDELRVHIAGLGDVKLATEPKHIESDIAGAGHILHPGDLDSD